MACAHTHKLKCFLLDGQFLNSYQHNTDDHPLLHGDDARLSIKNQN